MQVRYSAFEQTRSSLGNFNLLWFGPYPHSPYPFKYPTIHLCALIREKGIWTRKSFTKHTLISSPTRFLKAGWFDTGVTINTWTSEKHGLISSDHKTKDMGGRLLLRMNNQTDCLKIQYRCGSSELDSDLKVLIFSHTRSCYLLKLYSRV